MQEADGNELTQQATAYPAKNRVMQGHSAQQTDQAAQQGIEKTFLNQTMRRGMTECRRFRQQDGQYC